MREKSFMTDVYNPDPYKTLAAAYVSHTRSSERAWGRSRLRAALLGQDAMRLDGLWGGMLASQAQAITQAWIVKEVKGLLYLLTHLSPRVCLDLRKLELGVVGVHLADLLPGRGPENLGRAEKKKTSQHFLE